MRRVLGNNKGASLVFVLGIMLLLLIIGVSALTAASANTSLVISQRERNEIQVLDSSIHENIMYSLQSDATNENMLWYQMVMALYDAKTSGGALSDFELDISVDGESLENLSGNVRLESIVFSFPYQNVELTDAIPAIYEYAEIDNGDGTFSYVKGALPITKRRPATVKLEATLVVTVRIEARGRLITSRAVYDYTGGMLTDDPSGAHGDDDSGATYPMEFDPGGLGEWRLKKHEKVDI